MILDGKYIFLKNIFVGHWRFTESSGGLRSGLEKGKTPAWGHTQAPEQEQSDQDAHARHPAALGVNFHHSFIFASFITFEASYGLA